MIRRRPEGGRLTASVQVVPFSGDIPGRNGWKRRRGEMDRARCLGVDEHKAEISIREGEELEGMIVRSHRFANLRAAAFVVFCALLSAVCGCALVGPRMISAGRADYNEAINRTEDEQMLLAIVKGRYGETSSLLAVSGVAANVRFGTSAGVQAGFGPESNYAGNLVPFTGGMAYEENPTITYVPVQGERYLRQVLSPVPLDILILFIRNDADFARPFTLFANRINDMRNPNFLDGPSAEPDPRFQRFVELHSLLDRAGIVHLVADARKEIPFYVLISGYAPAYAQEVKEYLSLLGLPQPADRSSPIVIPVYFAVMQKELNGMAISTRSTYDMIQILQAAVEVPPEHAAEGLTIKYPPSGLAGRDVHIHSSKNEPKNAAIAVKHRGYWFYIDDANMSTKIMYRTARMLWSVSIAAAAEQKGTPLLTIPVSR
jgi:hypothetical protein